MTDTELGDGQKQERDCERFRGHRQKSVEIDGRKGRENVLVRKKKTPVSAIDERSEARSMMKVKMNWKSARGEAISR